MIRILRSGLRDFLMGGLMVVVFIAVGLAWQAMLHQAIRMDQLYVIQAR